MKKNGFTLVEIIAVIIILSIIAIIAVPSILDSRQSVKDKMFATKLETSKQAATLWAQDNKKCLKEKANNPTGTNEDCPLEECETNGDTVTCKIKLSDLAKASYLKYDEGTDIINPRDGSSMNETEVTVMYNVKSKTVEINVDAEGPIVALKGVPKGYSTVLPTISGKITDNSGVVGYVISTASPEDGKKPSGIDYANVPADPKKTTELSISYIITENISKKYYLYTADGLGNQTVKAFDIKIDTEPPVFDEVTDDCKADSTKCTITAKFTDAQSGIVGYQFTGSPTEPSSGYTEITATTEQVVIKNENVTENGKYYVWIKDAAKHTKGYTYEVTAIDVKGPDITDFKSNESTSYGSSFTVSAKIQDPGSGLVGYQFSTSNTTTPSSWTTVTATNAETPVSKSYSANGTYYLWAKDKLGNTSVSNGVKISHVGTLKSVTMSNSELTSSSFSNVSKSVSGAVQYDHATTTYGSLSKVTAESGYITISGSNSSYSSTCSESFSRTPNTTYPSSSCSSYYCPDGGSVSGTSCTNSTTYVENTNCYCSFVSGQFTWDGTYCEGYTSCPNDHYWRNSTADYFYIYTQSNGTLSSYTSVYDLCANKIAKVSNFGDYTGKKYLTARAYCYWTNYSASCSNYSDYCSSGWTLKSGTCYSCSSGSLSGYSCVGTENVSCTKYRYNFTIYYWAV